MHIRRYAQPDHIHSFRLFAESGRLANVNAVVAMDTAQLSDLGDIEQAVSTIVTWSMRNGVQQETMRRAKCSLPPGSVWLLARMAKCEPVRLSELAHALGVDNSTLTPQAQRLEREGLVAREPDPSDRRAALLHVTQRGRTLLGRLHSARREMFAQRLANWPDQDRALVASLLSRLAETLDSSTDL